MKEETMITEAVQAFCGAWFSQRDAEKAISFLADDVVFSGTGAGERAAGKAEMAA